MTQIKLACALGVIGGAMALIGGAAGMASAIRSTQPATLLLKDFVWAGCGAAQAILAVFLWRGCGWAFKRFAMVSVALALLFVSRSMDWAAFINLSPLVLLMMAVSPERSPRPSPVRIEPKRRSRRDRY